MRRIFEERELVLPLIKKEANFKIELGGN